MSIQEATGFEADPAPESYLYMFYSAGKIKIGTTLDPVHRLDALQNSSSAPVQLIWIGFGNRREEDRLHAMFKADRLHGEWFSLSDGIRSYITLASTEGAPFAAMLTAAERTWKSAPITHADTLTRENPGLFPVPEVRRGKRA